VRWHGGARGAIASALNFLWLLSLLQGKESNNLQKGKESNNLITTKKLLPIKKSPASKGGDYLS
jgi:hypothetical protein